MTDDVRALVRLSAALSPGLSGAEDSRLPALLEDAGRRAGDSAVDEVLLQSHLFLGYPVALNALAMWRRLRDHPPSGGVAEDPAQWADRGARVCRTIYGGQYGRLRQNVRDLHPDMERWMVADGYGRVMGRPGLSLETRELCAVAMLFGLPAERQLHSHLRGALNAGVDPADVEATLEIAGELVGGEPARVAAAVWDRVKERRNGWSGSEVREGDSDVH